MCVCVCVYVCACVCVCALDGGKVAGLIWIRFAFFEGARYSSTYLGLGSTYLGGHDDFAVGPTRYRYNTAPDVYQKCEDLRSNQPPFLVSSVRQ